ncbi:HesA/MoeB/ThiF family protein [Roseateles sp.]|uniref:HesA/MoeB/ThiF family protein n=1 Tax=Roseateles sp. TaxID=1971397 RepID=UPI00392B6CE5
MTDDQLLRYSRHLMLDEIGIEGQQRLLDARVLVVGAGGLGSPVALYLASAGVGHITLVDHDSVSLTNLQRQIAHDMASLNRAKVASAARRMLALNPDIFVRPIEQRADAALLDTELPRVDVVVDCTDNFATRQLVNAACVRHGKPLVSGAAIGFDGQVSVYAPHQGGPCYACLFAPSSGHEDVACATMGVFAPLVGIIGCTQAAEVLKLLIPTGQPLLGQLLMLDARQMAWSRIALQRDPHCEVCGSESPP